MKQRSSFRPHPLLAFCFGLVLVSCQGTSFSSFNSVATSSADLTYSVQAYLSGSDGLYIPTDAPLFNQSPRSNSPTLSLADEGVSFEGVGAAMTQSSAYLLESLSPSLRQQAFSALFSPNEGGFSLVRIPLGTSDYTNSSEFYTYDDLASGTDYDLAHFSLGKDQDYLLPALKDALAINPNLVFIAAPWSAPAWMKDSSSLIGGSLKSKSDGTNSPEEIAYAAYLIKTVEAFKAEGITISYLSLENEPIDFGGSINYPNMSLPASQWKRIAKSVGYQLKSKGLPTKILAYDHNVGTASENAFYQTFAEEIKNDATLASYVAGFGFHCYSGGWSENGPAYLGSQKKVFPDKKLFVTEITEHSGSGSEYDPRFDWAMENVLLGPLANGASGVCYWNLLLTNEGKPVLGNDAICYGVLSLENNTLVKTPAYGALSQFGHFLAAKNNALPIAQNLSLGSVKNLSGAAYRLGDGSLVVYFFNSGSASLSFNFTFQNKSAALTLSSAHSLVLTLQSSNA